MTVGASGSIDVVMFSVFEVVVLGVVLEVAVFVLLFKQ